MAPQGQERGCPAPRGCGAQAGGQAASQGLREKGKMVLTGISHYGTLEGCSVKAAAL